jgi:hypothetical protein
VTAAVGSTVDGWSQHRWSWALRSCRTPCVTVVLAVEDRAGTGGCRHGQHPSALPAGGHLGIPASENHATPEHHRRPRGGWPSDVPDLPAAAASTAPTSPRPVLAVDSRWQASEAGGRTASAPTTQQERNDVHRGCAGRWSWRRRERSSQRYWIQARRSSRPQTMTVRSYPPALLAVSYPRLPTATIVLDPRQAVHPMANHLRGSAARPSNPRTPATSSHDRHHHHVGVGQDQGGLISLERHRLQRSGEG